MSDLDRIRKQLNDYIVNDGSTKIVADVAPPTGDGHRELLTLQEYEAKGKSGIEGMIPLAKGVSSGHPQSGIFNEKILELSGELPGSMSLYSSNQTIVLRDAASRNYGENINEFQDRVLDDMVTPLVEEAPRVRRDIIQIARECMPGAEVERANLLKRSLTTE